MQTMSYSLTQFNIALFLMLGKSSRHEQKVFPTMKTWLHSTFKSLTKCQHLKWFPDASGLFEAGNILEQSLTECVKNTTHGWDNIVAPLIQLAFALLETNVTKYGSSSA